MSRIPLPTTSEEWKYLVSDLVVDGDLARTAASFYLFLSDHQQTAYNARNKQREEFDALSRAFKTSPFAPSSGKGILEIQARFYAICHLLKPELEPLDTPRRMSAAQRLGNEKVWVGAERFGPVRNEMKQRRQRTQDKLSDLLSVLHPGLFFAPAIVEDIELVPCTISEETARCLGKLTSSLRVAVAPLTASFQFQAVSTEPMPPDPRRGFRFTAIEDEAVEIAALEAAFAAAQNERACILVLPELRMPARMDARLRELLAEQDHPATILLAAGGSWHVNDPDLGWVNRCNLYDHRGDLIFSHEKLAEFRLTPDNVEKAPDLREALGLDGHGGFEDIVRGTRLSFCETPIGRVAVAICVGFFSKLAKPAVSAVRADHYLVPAMSSTTEDLAKFADDLVRNHGGATAVANCGTTGIPKKNAGSDGCFGRSAIWRKAQSGGTGGPVYVFDLLGHEQ